MQRISQAQLRVKQFHKMYQQEMNLPLIDPESSEQLARLLDKIYRFEHRCTLKKQKYSEAVCIEFRGAIADLLLLHDNFDLKHTIANRDNVDDSNGNTLNSVA